MPPSGSVGPGVVVLSEARGFKGWREARCEVGSLFPAFDTISDDKMEPNVEEFLAKTSRSVSRALAEAAAVGLPLPAGVLGEPRGLCARQQR